jgi:hypothetical protein
MSPLLSSISCTTSPTFPFVLAFSNPKTRLAASRYMHYLHLAIANQSEHCLPSFRSEMHGSRPRRICSSCLKTRVSTCTCVLIPNGPSSYESSQPHSKSGAAEREVLRDLLRARRRRDTPIAFDKTDRRLCLQSSSHSSGKHIQSCTSYIGVADPPRVPAFAPSKT